MSGKKSSTLAGQRELLREHTNKINELVESITNLENREAKHELDVITSMQYLENRVEELKDELKMLTTEVHVNLDKPYTAMRSTGDCARCGHNHHTDDYVFCNCCNTNAPQPQPIKPQEDVREKLMDYLKKINNPHSKESWLSIEEQADKILAIVKGE